MESNREHTHLHIAIIDRSESGGSPGVFNEKDEYASPVPQQEGERRDEEEVPWGRVRTIRSEWDEVRRTHPMLEPRSLPLSLAPTAKFTMQATMLKRSVAPRTSHS